MNAKDLVIAIKTLFDGKGTAEAQRQLDATGKKAKEAGEKTKDGFLKAGKGAELFQKTMGNLNKVITGFGVLAIIGAVTQLWNLLKGVIDWIKDRMTKSVREAAEESERLADALSSRRIELAQGIVDEAAKSYNGLADAITRVKSEQDAYLSALQELNQAQQEATELELQRRELAALASLQEGDTVGEASVKAKYGKLRLANSLGQQGAEAVRAAQRAEDELNATAERRAAAEAALKKAESGRGVIADQLAFSSDKLKEFELQPKRPGFKGFHDAQVEKRLRDEVAALTKQMKDLDDNIAKLTEAVRAEKSNERNAGIRLEAAKVRSTTVMDAATGLAEQKATDIDRTVADAKRAAEEERIRERLRTVTAKAKSVYGSYKTRADVYQAEADAFDPQRRDFDSRDEYMSAKAKDLRLDKAAAGAAKQADAVNRLLAQLERTPPDKIAALLNGFETQFRAFEAAIKNAEARSRRQ